VRQSSRSKRRTAAASIPTSLTKRLDARTTAHLYEALAAAMSGRSALLITHRLSGLAKLVDDAAVMRQGRIVECAPVAAYVDRMRARRPAGALMSGDYGFRAKVTGIR
jgi:ABC-type glutathione transport system ATPase component